MMHFLSPFRVSLLICFFIATTSTANTSLSHHDEYTSREYFKVPSKSKVTSILAIAKNSEGEMLKMINNAKMLKQVKSLEMGEAPKNLFLKDNVVVNEASSSIHGCQKIARRLLRGQGDMDAFVAYADYPGPRRHPPKNN